VAAKTGKTSIRGKSKKLTKEHHDEAFRILAGALMDGRKKRKALGHPVVGPIIKQLGPQFAKLSAMAKNQSHCDCDEHPTH
jgi:hypothetical protein